MLSYLHYLGATSSLKQFLKARSFAFQAREGWEGLRGQGQGGQGRGWPLQVQGEVLKERKKFTNGQTSFRNMFHSILYLTSGRLNRFCRFLSHFKNVPYEFFSIVILWNTFLKPKLHQLLKRFRLAAFFLNAENVQINLLKLVSIEPCCIPFWVSDNVVRTAPLAVRIVSGIVRQ